MPTDVVFLDTNGWIALLNASDVLHPVAEATWLGLLEKGSTVVVTDWVVAETGNGLARTRARTRFAEAVDMVSSSPSARLIPVSDRHFERALELYASRPDKTWGLVDCASFVVMEDEGVTEAFTNDRHFEQAGFKALLPRQ